MAVSTSFGERLFTWLGRLTVECAFRHLQREPGVDPLKKNALNANETSFENICGRLKARNQGLENTRLLGRAAETPVLYFLLLIRQAEEADYRLHEFFRHHAMFT